jgi:hypothetical protein
VIARRGRRPHSVCAALFIFSDARWFPSLARTTTLLPVAGAARFAAICLLSFVPMGFLLFQLKGCNGSLSFEQPGLFHANDLGIRKHSCVYMLLRLPLWRILGWQKSTRAGAGVADVDTCVPGVRAIRCTNLVNLHYSKRVICTLVTAGGWQM